jgi:hypothetical protein
MEALTPATTTGRDGKCIPVPRGHFVSAREFVRGLREQLVRMHWEASELEGMAAHGEPAQAALAKVDKAFAEAMRLVGNIESIFDDAARAEREGGA